MCPTCEMNIILPQQPTRSNVRKLVHVGDQTKCNNRGGGVGVFARNSNKTKSVITYSSWMFLWVFGSCLLMNAYVYLIYD
jgi:hypothetical protein